MNWVLLQLIPFLAWMVIWIIGKTIRSEVMGEENVRTLKQRGQNLIYAFWHNRLLLITYCLRHRGIQVLVSSSRDGEYISRTIGRFGASTIRGSTTSGGRKALLQMARKLKRGYDGAITPDGPQGPKYRVQPGIIHLAGKTRFPIVPLTYNARKKIILNSWDGFIVPCPFSRAVLIYGNPIEVSMDSTEEVIEAKRQELEKSLNSITRQADRYFE